MWCVSVLHQNATLHSLGSAATHPPRVKSIGWTVLDIIKMQTDRQTHTEIPAFIRENKMFSPLPPKLWIFGVDYYRSFEAQKMVFGPALQQWNQWCDIKAWLPVWLTNGRQAECPQKGKLHTFHGNLIDECHLWIYEKVLMIICSQADAKTPRTLQSE